MDDAVRGDVHADEFGTAFCGEEKRSGGVKDAAGVQDPEAVLGVEDDGLHADEVVCVVRAGRGRGGVVYGAAWGVVDGEVRVGGFGVVGVQFCDCVAGYVAGVGVVGLGGLVSLRWVV